MSDLEASGRSGAQYEYQRVAEDITAQITSGALRPGARLLSERALAEHYGVAFHTVRHAMQILRERGLVESVHGRGTYVRQPAADDKP
jgi:GntR family transcriptional regulator